jgi:hypothetical protein
MRTSNQGVSAIRSAMISVILAMPPSIALAGGFATGGQLEVLVLYGDGQRYEVPPTVFGSDGAAQDGYNLVNPTPGGFIDMDSFSQVQGWTLKARAKMEVRETPDFVNGPVWSSARYSLSQFAQISETITITHESPGQQYRYYIPIACDGTLSWNLTRQGAAIPLVEDSSVISASISYGSQLQFHVPVFESLKLGRIGKDERSLSSITGTIAIPYTSGVPFDVQLDLGVSTDLDIRHVDDESFRAQLLSDFSNTVTILGIGILDENGNHVTQGVTVQTASGRVLQVIPEPHSIGLLAIGSAVACSARPWTRRRQR